MVSGRKDDCVLLGAQRQTRSLSQGRGRNGTEELLYEDTQQKIPYSWSPDGRFLLFTGSSHIWALPLGERGTVPLKPAPFMRSASFTETDPQFSPDGRWVAYASNESGRFEIYAAPFPGPGGKRQISTSRGLLPRWRQDGRELFYISDGQLTATEVSVKGDTLEVGATHTLFGQINTNAGYFYDVSADGQRILATVAGEQRSGEPVTLVQNWVVGLKK